MKRCPECRRNYYDETLLYCLDDGNALLDGPAAASEPAAAGGLLDSADEPATAILSVPEARVGVGTGLGDGEATRPQIHTTNQTGILRTGPEAEPRESFGGLAERRGPSANRAAEPQRKRNRLLTILGIVLLLVVSGFFSYRYLKTEGGGQISSIAVLPFENRGGNTDTEYLSDGIAESLIFRLSQLPNLKVSPVSSVVRYKGKEFDAAKIAAELGVGAVMFGRMTQRGDSIAISVELIDAANNKILWGEQYDRKISDLLATQREIAATITQKLQLKLSGNEKALTKKYTSSNEAYQLWMKGRFHFTKRTKTDLFKSIEVLEEAVKLDPSFALAYVGIAESYTVIPSFPYDSPANCIPKAKAAAARALELDPELAEAHTVSAMIAATYDWDWARAEAGFKRALELDPNVSITHYRYAWTYLSPMGRHDEAVAEMKIAMEKEPLYLIQGANYAAILLYARRFDEAVEQARKTYDLDPDFLGSINWLGHSYAAKGMYAEALTMVEKRSESDMPLRAAAGYVYAKTGQRDKALANIAEWKEIEKVRYVQNYWVAIAYAAMGDKDGAFAELEKAYENRDWFLQRLKVDPFMDPLRDDPRYLEMLKRLNLPE